MSPSIDLAPDAVDVWRGSLEFTAGEMNGMLEFLSPAERERVATVPEERAVRQFVVSRVLQRRLLAGYVGGPPADIQFGVVGMGKPTLAHPNDIELTFNTTHSGNLVVIAVTAKRDVGVDMEKVRPTPRALQLAKRFFSGEEFRMLSALPASELDRAFLSVWVRREGTTKARGDSVWRGLASWRNGELEETGTPRYRVEPLPLGQEYVGVVVADGSDWRVVMRGDAAALP